MSEEHEKNTRVYIKADSKVPDLYILTLKAISAIQQGDPIVHTQRAIPEILQAFRFLSGSVLSAR